jgi:glycosyltransferase involved in cell wall biosynthesis
VLEALIQKYNLGANVQLAGWVDQRRLGEELRRSQVFAFPSLREFGGGVVLEALAGGLPAIIVDYGGPAELVTPESGILLPMEPREALIGKLQRAMEELAGDPARCRALGNRACQRVREEYTWQAKAERIVQFYQQTLT